MYEVEVKVRADHAAVRRRLEERGATRRGAVTQVDTYYDAPHRDFAETDEALRLRYEQSSVDEASDDEGTDREATDSEAADSEATDSEAADGETIDDDAAAVDGDTDAETRVKLTYKGPLLERESKSREEHETAVCDPESTEAIFESLGFEPAATVEKERDRYSLDDYTVTLDSVDGLGEFVEVETETPDDAIADARDGARTLLESLGLDPEAQIRTSYLGLILESNVEDSQ